MNADSDGLLAGRQGLEPRYADPESAVLPLDDLPAKGLTRQYTTWYLLGLSLPRVEAPVLPEVWAVGPAVRRGRRTEPNTFPTALAWWLRHSRVPITRG